MTSAICYRLRGVGDSVGVGAAWVDSHGPDDWYNVALGICRYHVFGRSTRRQAISAVMDSAEEDRYGNLTRAKLNAPRMSCSFSGQVLLSWYPTQLGSYSQQWEKSTREEGGG